jgi:hypothetical protein
MNSLEKNPRGWHRAGRTQKLAYVVVGNVVPRSLNGDTVELNVRTLRDILVERRLVESCVGVRSHIRAFTDCGGREPGISALDLGVHAEAGARIKP